MDYRCDRWRAGVIDLHSHLVPGFDDGAATLDESRAALSAFREAGFTAVVTTPHFRASELVEAGAASQLALLDEGWAALKAMAAVEFSEIRLERGLEVNLDLPVPDLSDPRVRMAGTTCVLVEFPFFTVPPNAANALFELRMKGFRPILAHPERYANLNREYADVLEFRRVGACMQVNAGSLLGKYGADERRRAWEMLARGLVDYVASDFHARGNLHSRAAFQAVEAAGGTEQAQLLFDVNPGRILADEALIPVRPLAPARPFWARWLGRGSSPHNPHDQ
jgi:protein-tyrosine phosphatase